MIKTKEFKLTKGEYYQIILANYFISRWWLITGFILVMAYLLCGEIYELAIMISTISTILLLYVFFVAIYFWIYTNSKANRIFFKERFYEIDKDFLTGILKDGSVDKINLDNIVKVKKTSRYYLLYISKTQFIYLPFSIFLSQQDLEDFQSLLREKRLI